MTLIGEVHSMALRASRLSRREAVWAEPETTLVVCERSALAEGERGVPVLRPGSFQ